MVDVVDKTIENRSLMHTTRVSPSPFNKIALFETICISNPPIFFTSYPQEFLPQTHKKHYPEFNKFITPNPIFFTPNPKKGLPRSHLLVKYWVWGKNYWVWGKFFIDFWVNFTPYPIWSVHTRKNFSSTGSHTM